MLCGHWQKDFENAKLIHEEYDTKNELTINEHFYDPNDLQTKRNLLPSLRVSNKLQATDPIGLKVCVPGNLFIGS